MNSDFDYKKYSLEKLQEWVHDALSTGEASPHEIYSAIREAVREDYYYYKHHCSRAFGLLELLSGHRPVKDTSIFQCNKDDPSPECQGAWNDFWEQNYYPEEVEDDGMRPWGHSDLEYKGSTVSNVDQKNHSKHYYDYTRNDPNRSNPFEDKVKKWILPVEECKDADTDETECFVSFPDDLLEAADLKEGDQVYWVDNGDGTWMIRKVTKPIVMDEC